MDRNRISAENQLNWHLWGKHMDQLPSGMYCWCQDDNRLSHYNIWYLNEHGIESMREANMLWYKDMEVIVDYQDHPRESFMAADIDHKRVVFAFTLGDAYSLVDMERGKKVRPRHRVLDSDKKELVACQSIPTAAVISLQEQLLQEFEARMAKGPISNAIAEKQKPDSSSEFWREISPNTYIPR